MCLGRWLFSKTLCDIFNANDVLFSTASLLHLCCISMDRYIAILDPFHYHTRMTKLRAGLMLGAAWGASALISHGPIHAGWYTTEDGEDRPVHECSFVVNKVYAIVSSSVTFWTPLTVMVFAYVKIYREALRQQRSIRKYAIGGGYSGISNGISGGISNGSGSLTAVNVNSKAMKREHKAAKTLGIIMGCFLCCWLPFFLWYVIVTFCTDCYTPPTVEALLFWIGYCNSAVNPIVYAFYNRDFRRAFVNQLCCTFGQNTDSSSTLGGGNRSHRPSEDLVQQPPVARQPTVTSSQRLLGSCWQGYSETDSSEHESLTNQNRRGTDLELRRSS